MQFIAISTLLAEFQLGFPTGRDGATFRDSGTGKIRDGTGRDSQNPGSQDKTGHSRKGRTKKGKR